ncbi:MAG: hypothetical protein M0Q45_10080, partial [Bacteroidales bacterium]|nr:hypothetical protein [Bacteroidales bacterium]
MVPIITFLKKLPQSLRTGLLGIMLTVLSLGGAFSQTDTEFWFAVPEITLWHQLPGGVPAYFKFSSGEYPATVTISMPAGDPAIFPDIVVELAPYDFHEEDVSRWIVSPNNPPFNPTADTNPLGYYDVNQLENKPLNATGVNDFGIKITSTSPITAYYEVSRNNNKDIWALKGKNALGTEFYTPFQTDKNNVSIPETQPYSAIDIVAIDDYTDVTFFLPPGIRASYGEPMTHSPVGGGGTVQVTLMEGETFSLFPYNKSRDRNLRLEGTRIESSQPIAVTLNDDSFQHTGGGCYDVAGDQLIPIRKYDPDISDFRYIIGKEYVVIRTDLYENATSNRHDHIYILATENTTNITVYNTAGGVVGNYPLNAGQQQYIRIPDPEVFYRIVSDKPVYVWHIGGFGCEVGGAILPPIDKCTGVPRVSFARTSGETFYIVMMVRKGAEEGFEFDGVERDDLFDPNDFREVDGSDWSVARFGPFNTTQISVGTHFMRNTEDIFHLGIVNGGAGTGCFYGYFSDYNEFNPETLVIETGSEGGRICSGQTLSLYASGGTKYEWTPSTYLDDPTSETPTAYNIESSINYTVTISGACNTFATRHVNLQVGGPVTASFDSDLYTACAVPPSSGATPSYTFNFSSTSSGDFVRFWSWQLGESGAPTQFAYGSDGTPSYPVTGDPLKNVSLTLENNTDQILEYHIKLRTADSEEFCFQEVTKIIRVYPHIDVSANHTLVGDPNCQPLEVNFTATPIGNFDGATYKWDFDDGNSAATQNASNTYNNTAPPYSSIDYYPEVTITDKWNVCSATDNVLVRVPPYLEASFTANPVEGCSPLQVTNFSNTSKDVPADGHSWKLYRLGAPDVEVGSSITGSPPDISSASTLLVNNRTDNLEEVYRLDLEVTNASGCVKTYSQEFTVYPNPTATVSIVAPGAPDINCSPLQIDLSATTIRNTNSFQWLVDGVSRLSNPDPIGSPPANYTGSLTLENFSNAPIPKVVSYKATNTWGCEFVSTPLNVDVQPHIHSEIVLDPEVICPDSETGEFDVQILDANIVADGQYEWFIDGVSQGINTDIGTRTFDYNTLTKNANGEAVIDLKLVVENAAGCTRIDNQQIKVNPRVSVNFDASIGATLIAPGAGGTGTTLCPPETVKFTSDVTYANSYHWQFGSLKEATTLNSSLDITNAGSAAFDLPVTLTASNSYGCSGSIKKTYTIEPEVVANFNIKSQAGCAPFTLEVNAIGIGTTYNWTFNGQVINNNANPSFIPVGNQTGGPLVRPIILKAVRGKCSLENKDISVTIYPEVRAQLNFTAPADYCAPVDNATFTNNSDLYVTANKVNNIQWEVFDGATMVTSTSAASFKPILPNTSHTAQKNYNVRLTATSAHGCVGQVDNQITVDPNPLARFNASITDACTPLVLDVVNESVTKAGSTYTWDWDNESSVSSSGQDHTVTYNNNTATVESKHISLNILNEYGCVSDYDYLFEVFPQVNANLSIARLTPNDNCGDETFTFTNNSTAGSTIKYYEWTFGTDKMVTSSTDDFKRSFTAHGTNPLDIPVSVKAFNSIGCSNVVPAQETIIVFPKVVAAQSFAIGDICDGDVDLTLTNASSNVGTHANATPNFRWTFTPSTGDGTPKTSTGGSVDLINSGLINPVVYDVDFIAETVWNYKSITRTCKNEITGNPVTVYPNLSPIYDIPDAICSGLTGAELVFVKNAASSGGNVGDVSIQWDFSDGNTRTTGFNPNVTKLFTNLSDEDFITTTKIFATQTATGCTANREIDVRVHPKVESIFTFELGDVCTYPLPVTFTNASKYSKVQTGVNTTFHWNYGYNWSGVNQEDTRTSGAGHTYSFYNSKPDETVDYDITLTIKQEHQVSNLSCNHQFSRKITVHPEQVANFNLPVVEGCNPLTVEFKNLSTGVLPAKGGKFAWTFGDGTGSSILDPSNKVYSHTNREQSIDYPIELTTTNPLGCKKTTTGSIEVYPLVVSSFDIGQLAGCTPLNVEVNNTSVSSAYKYDWSFTNGNPGTSNAPQPGTIQFINPLGASDVLAVQHPVLHLKTLLDITKYPVGGGCAEEDSKTVDVYPHVYPSFNATLEGCHPLENVEFENTSNVIGGTDKGTY